jgi:hypothetical protein
VQRREVQLLGGFAAQADRRLHFGLGESAEREVEVTVEWYGGPAKTLRLAVDRLHRLTGP